MCLRHDLSIERMNESHMVGYALLWEILYNRGNKTVVVLNPHQRSLENARPNNRKI